MTTDLIGPPPRLAVDRTGEGPLVVFLHGIGGNRTNWRDQVGAFTAHYTAAAWDARGYGASDDYAGPLAFDDFAADLRRVLDHYGVRRAHLVGLSMGGRIAMRFYFLHPPRVATLTLCDTHRGFASLTAEQRTEYVRLRREAGRGSRAARHRACRRADPARARGVAGGAPAALREHGRAPQGVVHQIAGGDGQPGHRR